MRQLGYSQLENEFINTNDKIVYMARGNTILFPIKEAKLYIDFCKKHKLKVLGIDGFKVIGDSIQPQQEHSSKDFDSDSFEDAFSNAEIFLNQRDTDGLWFEIVT